MHQKEESLLKVLEKSRDFERKGSQLYIELAIGTQQILAKNLLFNLAKQEIDHIIRIDEIFNAIHQNRPWPQIYQREITNVEEEMKKVFNRLDRKAREEKLDNIRSYQLAIDFEKQSYQMYKEFSENVTDESQKRFFVSLAEEEKKHLEALDNVYHFLTHTEDWLSTEESKVWNWMAT